ncbi:GNAT family N-acetyltransferase [candidate division WOR-3 bacterium]|nr:GNAT family N-acetyltransferase [candidate division WOR-3 bacterium]
MNIRIEKYTPAEAERWDEFINDSGNGTIFHTRRFLSYHPSERFNDRSLIIKENNNWVGVFPAALSDNAISSHPGASYGGIIFNDFTGIKKIHQITDTLIDYIRNELKCNQIEITLPPIIYHTTLCNYLDFALLRNNFTYKKRELSAYIPITKNPFNIFKQESRTATRKSKRDGVVVKEGRSIEDFYHILENNLSMRHNVEPTHTLSELLLLKELFPSRIRLFSSIYKEKQIASTLLFETNKKVVLAFYISHIQEYQHLRPVNLLFYEVIRWAYRNRYHFLDLGTFTLDMEPNFGLGRFKESLGARGIFRDYLQLTL